MATNDGSTLLTLQTKIYAKICQQPRPLDDLMRYVIDPVNLQCAWHRVRSNAGARAAGPDGQSCAGIESNCREWLKQLATQLADGTFRPTPPRWVDVPKRPGSPKMRRLGILAVADRVVHTAIKQILELVLEPTFHPHSFGFRPGRSVSNALAAATSRFSHPSDAPPAFRYAVHLDIADCFGSIDHALLFEMLRQHVADPALLALLQTLLHAYRTPSSRWWSTRHCGLVQGSALSPLLCNLYLHPIDVALDAHACQRDHAVVCLRYADDLLLAARTSYQLRVAIGLVRQQLRRLRLRLRSWPRICSLDRGVTWLGVHIAPRHQSLNGRRQFGYSVPEDKVRELIQTIDQLTQLPPSQLDRAALNIGPWINSVNDVLRQCFHVYQFADNASQVFSVLDQRSRYRVHRLIAYGTGLGRHELERRYRYQLPRGFWTWRIDGTQLIQLASRSPHASAPAVRRPAWMRSSGKRHRQPRAPGAARCKLHQSSHAHKE